MPIIKWIIYFVTAFDVLIIYLYAGMQFNENFCNELCTFSKCTHLHGI